MKLIMENWRGYLKEEEEEPIELTQQQIKLVANFIKNVAVVTQAAEDDIEGAETGLKEEEAVTGFQKASLGVFKGNKSKHKVRRAKKIKKMAGLEGIKKADFTPEQQNLYNIARKEFHAMDDAQDVATLDTVAHGDMLKLPLIKQLVSAGGRPLKAALIAIAGAECAQNLNMRCLTTDFYTQMQNYGIDIDMLSTVLKIVGVGKRDDDV